MDDTSLMTTEKTENTFFGVIKAFFSRIFAKKRSKRKIALNSRFGHLLENISPDSEVFSLACEVTALCDESVSVISQRLLSINKLKLIDEQLEELECFNRMDDQEADRLKGLLESFISLGKDKNLLKYQITAFDSSLTKMEKLEDQAPDAIEEIRYAEDKQRIFRQDLSYLQGEKAELEYERESLLGNIEFMYKFSIGLVIIFAVVIMALVFLFVFGGEDIFLPLAIISVMVLITTSMIYVLRRNIRYNLAINAKKQQRAVGLINRKGTVYAHYTNFLNYEYKKFKVKSSDMLKRNLKDYNNYKYLTKRFDSIRSIMLQTEEEISRILRENGIPNNSLSLENFAKTFSIDDKKEYYRELLGQKGTIEKELISLDERQEKIWDTLIIYNESDSSEEKFIDTIIQHYMQHVSTIIESPAIRVREPESEEDEETEEQIKKMKKKKSDKI